MEHDEKSAVARRLAPETLYVGAHGLCSAGKIYCRRVITTPCVSNPLSRANPATPQGGELGGT